MATSTLTSVRTNPLFHEEQRFRQWWLWALLGGTGAVTLASAGVPLWEAATRSDGGWEAAASEYGAALLGPVVLAAVAALLAASRLVVDVYRGEVRESGTLRVRFRGLFVDRKIPLADVTRAEAVTYAPLKDYGGWGLRSGPRGKAYNVSGDRGVEVALASGETFLVGSQRAEALAAAIREARGDA